MLKFESAEEVRDCVTGNEFFPRARKNKDKKGLLSARTEIDFAKLFGYGFVLENVISGVHPFTRLSRMALATAAPRVLTWSLAFAFGLFKLECWNIHLRQGYGGQVG